MHDLLTFILIGVSALSMGLAMAQSRAEAAEPLVAHIVYFSLKDRSEEAKKHLVAECDKFLTDHEGTVFYATGVVSDQFDREVNVRDFDVALHVFFESKAAHDKYQTAPRHLQFIKDNKDTWKSVRVFDAMVNPASLRAKSLK